MCLLYPAGYEQARELLSKITDTSARRELVLVLDPKSLPSAEPDTRAVVLSPVRRLADNEVSLLTDTLLHTDTHTHIHTHTHLVAHTTTSVAAVRD